MGRPNQCNTCCGDIGDPPDPPISQCDNVICVVFIDENERTVANGGTFAGQARMATLHPLFRAAYPDRLLFVLDCFNSNATMYYSDSFINDPLAFSLRNEYRDNSSGLIEFLSRDNGDGSIANTNDPWARILTIKERYPSVKTLFDAASEISIFADDSASLQALTQMEATLSKLRADANTDGYNVARSIDNTSEDIICPFAQSQCCTSDAQDLMDECGVDVSCSPVSLSFTKSPDDAMIREYCDNTIASDSDYFGMCNGCVTPSEETQTQTTEFTAVASTQSGQNADWVEVRYTLEASDNNGSSWSTIQNLPNGFSGTEQELNALDENWGGSFVECHDWLGGNDISQYGSKITLGFTTVGFGEFQALSKNGSRVLAGNGPATYGSSSDAGYARILEWSGSAWEGMEIIAEGVFRSDDGFIPIVTDFSDTLLQPYYLSGDGNRIVFCYAENLNDPLTVRTLSWGTRRDATYDVWEESHISVDGSKITTPSLQVEPDGLPSTYMSIVLNYDGTRLAVINHYTNEVRIFSFTDIGWVQLGNTINFADGFHQIEFAPNNDIVISNRSDIEGVVKVFRYNNGAWGQVGSDIRPPDTVHYEIFGRRIDVDGTGSDYKIIVSDSGWHEEAWDTSANDGIVHVYEFVNGNWSLLGDRILPPDRTQQSFGRDVSIVEVNSETYIAISSYDRANIGSYGPSIVRLYQLINGSWVQIGSNIVGDSDSSANFGLHIDLGYSESDGLVLAVADIFYNVNRNDNGGAVITYRYGSTETHESPCTSYSQNVVGSCLKRTWDRIFRIKAETNDYPLTAYSGSFKIYEWRNTANTVRVEVTAPVGVFYSSKGVKVNGVEVPYGSDIYLDIGEEVTLELYGLGCGIAIRYRRWIIDGVDTGQSAQNPYVIDSLTSNVAVTSSYECIYA